MQRYLATFAAGFEPIVRKFFDGTVSSGMLITNTVPPEQFFKNIFIILDKYANKASVPTGAKTFKLSVFNENVPSQITRQMIFDIEKCTGLKYKTTGGDVDYWRWKRQGGKEFFLQKISKTLPQTEKGQLESHVAALLCLLSNMQNDDVFIDPFCGHGTIPIMRAKLANYKGIFATDKDAASTNALKNKIKKVRNSKIQKSFFIKTMDFLKNKFEDNFMDAIVTDPPWGIYENINDDFYQKIMTEFERILKPGGRLVFLLARDTKIETRMQQSLKTDVLIHGKKATVYAFLKP